MKDIHLDPKGHYNFVGRHEPVDNPMGKGHSKLVGHDHIINPKKNTANM